MAVIPSPLADTGPYVLLAAVAVVGLTPLQEAVDHGQVLVEPVGLAVLLVPVHAEPAQAVTDVVDQLGAGAVDVGVLDPQDEGAAGAAGVQPVEQGGAGAADVQVPGRGRGEAYPYGHE